jgi:hypothetical protein
VLRALLGDGAAAVGWRGDRYALWDVPVGSPVLLSLTAWDGVERASEFARAYARVLVAKHGLAPRADGPVLAWAAGTETSLIEGRGRLVLILEGAPDARVDAIRAAVWTNRVLY